MDAKMVPADHLPPGRDWRSEVEVGIHAPPSLGHLHVHIVSKDRCGPRMESGSQYNQFVTPFFVSIDEFPLPKDDPRRSGNLQALYLQRNLGCWRCSGDFGNDFSMFKAHLQKELDEWKRI
jgi:aprataxin